MTSDATAPERNPFLEAVGRVTVAGAQMDHSLHALLGSIAFEPTLINLANAENTVRLIEWCRKALELAMLEPEHVAEVKACLDRADKLRKERNALVHSIYLPLGEGASIDAFKPQMKKLGSTVTSITVEDMEATAKRIEALRHDMFEVGWNLRCRFSGMAPIPRPAPSSETSAKQE